MTDTQTHGFDLGLVCDFRLLCRDMMQATIPDTWLRKAKAVSVDQTAFPSFFRSHDFRKQADIDKEVKRAIEATGMIPDDLQLGPDGKLIRCADPDARAGHRSASAATGHKATGFLGYNVTLAVLTRLVLTQGNSTKPGDAVPCYIAGISVDPASFHPGIAARKAVEDALAIAPGLEEVLTDMGISQHGEAFVRPMHELGLDVIRDLKANEAQMKMIEVGTGKHRQHLLAVDGMFFSPWLPKRFHQVPDGLSKEQLQEWYEQRARFRWSRTQRFDNGDMQFRCPQCAGRITTNLTTHRKRARPNKSAPFVTVTHHDDNCCKGLVTIPVDELDYWQPTPWGTAAWRESYSRRLQVENVNSMVKADGGLAPSMCRARGIGAHTLAALMACIAHNLNEAKKDPDADDANSSTGADDGTEHPGEGDPGEDDDNLPEIGAGADMPDRPDDGDSNGDRLRAPP